MKKRIILLLAALMALLQCAEWGFEYDNPLDERGRKTPGVPNEPTVKKETFTDSRDGKVYTKVTISGQTWMAENLNYAAEGSKCYEDNPSNCATYGRLYNWATALTACPAGWHIPSDAEWDILVEYAGGWETAGTKLKSRTGWNSYSGVPAGTDDYGFTALPGGYGLSDGIFDDAGSYGGWWSATEINADYAWFRFMYYGSEDVFRNYYDTTILFSVRCVENTGYAISINGGTMVWLVDIEDPTSVQPLQNGDILWEDDIVIILSAEPGPGKQFVRWDVFPSRYEDNFILGRDAPNSAFIMPAANVTITAVFEDVGLPEAYTISISGGTMVWWEDTSDPDATSPLNSGDILWEDDIVIILSAEPGPGKQFVRWDVTPASAAGRFYDRTDPRTTFQMPASNVVITAVFETVVTYSTEIKFTWEAAEQDAIWSIAASENDVAFWLENYFDAAFLVDEEELPLFSGSPELPDNIYSKTIGSLEHKGKLYPIEEGLYTAVCSIEDDEFEGAYWDIVANYIVMSPSDPLLNYEGDLYYEIFFDVGGFFSGLTDEYWLFDVFFDRDQPDYLTKAQARAKKLIKIGTKKFPNGGEATYYLLHRQKKA